MKHARLVAVCLVFLPFLALGCKPRVEGSLVKADEAECPDCAWLASALTELNDQLLQEGVAEVVAQLDGPAPAVEGLALTEDSSGVTLQQRIAIIQAQADQIKAMIGTKRTAQTDKLNKTLDDLGGILRELNNTNAVPPAPGSPQTQVSEALSLIQTTLTQTQAGAPAAPGTTPPPAPKALICSTLSNGTFLPHAKDTGRPIGAAGVGIDACRRLINSQNQGLICTTLSNGNFLPYNLAAQKHVGSAGMGLDSCLRTLSTMAAPLLCSTLSNGNYLPHDVRNQRPIGSAGIGFDACVRSVREFKQGVVCTTLSNGNFLPHQLEPFKILGSSGVSADTCSKVLKAFDGQLLCSTLPNGNFLPTNRAGKALGQCGMGMDACLSVIQKQEDGLICTTMSNCNYLPMTIATEKFVGSAGTGVQACLQSIGR